MTSYLCGSQCEYSFELADPYRSTVKAGSKPTRRRR